MPYFSFFCLVVVYHKLNYVHNLMYSPIGPGGGRPSSSLGHGFPPIGEGLPGEAGSSGSRQDRGGVQDPPETAGSGPVEGEGGGRGYGSGQTGTCLIAANAITSSIYSIIIINEVLHEPHVVSDIDIDVLFCNAHTQIPLPPEHLV